MIDATKYNNVFRVTQGKDKNGRELWAYFVVTSGEQPITSRITRAEHDAFVAAGVTSGADQ